MEVNGSCDLDHQNASPEQPSTNVNRRVLKGAGMFLGATGALAAAVLLCLGTAVAQTPYTVIDLGTLGGTFSDTGGVNNQGQSAGGSSIIGDGALHAFLWNNGVMTDLGTLGGPNSKANAVSNTTGVVGFADISNLAGNPSLCGVEFVNASHQCHAFLWQNGTMVDLGTLGGNSSGIGGDGVNSRGQAVGSAETATPNPNFPPFQLNHAFLWQSGVMADLGTLGGPTSSAACVNDAGQVVGGADTSTSAGHPFLWELGVMRDLGTLGGSFGFALQINGQGQVIGAATTAGDANLDAFVWENGVMTDVGRLPGDVFSIATDINDKGQVVGLSCDASGNCSGFLWQNGVMTDVESLIPADSPLRLVTAFQIKARGQIVGNAIEKSTGQSRGYLATPRPGRGTAGQSVGLAPQPQTVRVGLPVNARTLLQQRLQQLGFGRFTPVLGQH